MKVSLFITVLLAEVLSVGAQMDTIGDYASDIPSCAFSAFKKALQSEECDVDNVGTDTLDCFCRHLSAVAVAVAQDSSVDSQCSIGKLCRR